MKLFKSALTLLSVLAITSSCVEITERNTVPVTDTISQINKANHSISVNEHIVSDIVSSVKMVSFIDSDVSKKVTHEDITKDLVKGNLLELFNDEQEIENLDMYENYFSQFKEYNYGDFFSSSFLKPKESRDSIELFEYKINGDEDLRCALEVKTSTENENIYVAIGDSDKNETLIHEDKWEKGLYYILLSEEVCNRVFLDNDESILIYTKGGYLGESGNQDSFLARKSKNTWKLYSDEDKLYEDHNPNKTYCVNDGPEIGRWICKEFDKDITIDDF